MWVCVFILLWYHAKTCACGVLCRKCVGSLKCPEQKEKLKYNGFQYKLGVPVRPTCYFMIFLLCSKTVLM